MTIHSQFRWSDPASVARYCFGYASQPSLGVSSLDFPPGDRFRVRQAGLSGSS